MSPLHSFFSTILICTSVLSYNAMANTTPANSNTQPAVVAYGANYGLFEYTDTDSLIKTVQLLEKFGFNTAVVASTLDLNSYNGSVIIFKRAAGGKPLSYEDALSAFKNFMKPLQFSTQDVGVVKNTPLSINEGGTLVKQSYQVLYAGQNIQGSQPFRVPAGGIALTIVKMGDGKLLVITTSA